MLVMEEQPDGLGLGDGVGVGDGVGEGDPQLESFWAKQYTPDP